MLGAWDGIDWMWCWWVLWSVKRVCADCAGNEIQRANAYSTNLDYSTQASIVRGLVACQSEGYWCVPEVYYGDLTTVRNIRENVWVQEVWDFLIYEHTTLTVWFSYSCLLASR
jgi:hypothetical protein